jgi:hypothetical protein
VEEEHLRVNDSKNKRGCHQMEGGGKRTIGLANVLIQRNWIFSLLLSTRNSNLPTCNLSYALFTSRGEDLILWSDFIE